MKSNKFIFSQTALKQMEAHDYCPTKWKAMWLDKKWSMETNEQMDRGKYFEFLAIGAGAIYGDDVTELPANKNGSIKIDTKRIQLQAERCKRMLFDKSDPEYLGLTVIDIQVDIGDGKRKGTIDIICKDAEGNVIIIDLKLTKDLTNDRPVVRDGIEYHYGWGNVDELDFIQQIHYKILWEKANNEKSKAMVMVFDHSPDMLCKIIDIEISPDGEEKTDNRFTIAEKTVEHYHKEGWAYDPSEYECDSCKVEDCPFRFVKETLIRETITI